MLFSSLEFLFLFLPIAVGVYFLLPKRFRNASLLVSGFCFYGFGEPKFLPLMALTVAVDFLFGLAIAKRKRAGKSARALLWSAVIFNIGLLAFFKYFDFLLKDIFGLSPLGIELPIGISFYTFQALSYVIDVYRQEVAASESIVDFGAYVSLFPQLIAGPIVQYSDVERELKTRRHSCAMCAEGLRRFCAGLSKKVILANPAGEMWERLCGSESFVGSWLGIFFFSMQIYFDFSGYSDMALGLGKVFGFDFPENFNYPYISKSITEFWRRWHITLSSWFRDYVYIPLGGNRRGRARTYLNLLITWALTGIWHGAQWNFLAWGLYFCLLLIIEKAFLAKLLTRLPPILSHIYALVFIAVGWVIFASSGEYLSFYGGARYALRLFGIGCRSFIGGAERYELTRNIIFALIMILGCTRLPRKIYIKTKERLAGLEKAVDVALPLMALLLSVAYLAGSGYNPFLYFRF